MAKVKKDEIFALVDEKLNKCKEEMRIDAEIVVCKFILGLIRDITNEVKTLDDLDTFICAMIKNREQKVRINENSNNNNSSMRSNTNDTNNA